MWRVNSDTRMCRQETFPSLPPAGLGTDSHPFMSFLEINISHSSFHGIPFDALYIKNPFFPLFRQTWFECERKRTCCKPLAAWEMSGNMRPPLESVNPGGRKQKCIFCEAAIYSRVMHQKNVKLLSHLAVFDLFIHGSNILKIRYLWSCQDNIQTLAQHTAPPGTICYPDKRCTLSPV